MKLLFLTFLVVLSFSSKAENKARFASIFTDNLVLQQKSFIKIWGYAKAGEKLSLKCSWINTNTKIVTDKNGKWQSEIKTPQAGFEPQVLVLTDSQGSTNTLSNILIGEVWLCSGQSNMEMILQNQVDGNKIVENSEQEITKSDFPKIRFLTVDRKESFFPVDEIISPGWKICNPENVKWISAVAYFFGKELFHQLNVPVGLVISAYGGSPVQSWIPKSIIESDNIYKPEKKDRDEEMMASTQKEEDYVKAMSEWIANAEKKQISETTEKIVMDLPVNIEKSKVGIQLGEIQFSKIINIPESLHGNEIHVSLGTMDDLGRVFFNGELVWQEVRNSKSYSSVQFTIPAEKVKPGVNLIEAKVLNLLWGGGLTGPANKMYYTIGTDPKKRSLTGEWNYKKIFDMAKVNPVPREGKPLFSMASVLYNGMIYPLRDYGFKGCLWYQGESNVGDDTRYQQMFSDMIISWRKMFSNDFPFYFVQIAPYNYGGGQKGKATLLRDAQARVAAIVPKTGMVVTIDIGSPENVHPSKKKEVGDRLAAMALSETYHKTIACKYPLLKNANSTNDTIVMHFSNIYKTLVSKGQSNEFEISEDDKTYFPANTEISFDKIKVWNQQVLKPKYVRYCWRDGDHGTIFNSENLPLSSFKTESSK